MEIRAAEISQVIREQIKDYEKRIEVSETGTVLSVGDGIARVYGLQKAMAMEMVEFPGNIFGLCLNLEEDNVGVAIMGDDSTIKEGDVVKRTRRIAEIPVGDAVLGRVIDAVGNPLDGTRAHQHDGIPPGRDGRTGRYCAPTGDRAHVYGHEGHRCHDTHRPRPEGAHHRRPSDRQDGHWG